MIEIKISPQIGTGRFNSCRRKIRFRTYKSAQNYLNKNIKKKGIIVQNANIYHCNFCRGFHLGHAKESI